MIYAARKFEHVTYRWFGSFIGSAFRNVWTSVSPCSHTDAYTAQHLRTCRVNSDPSRTASLDSGCGRRRRSSFHRRSTPPEIARSPSLRPVSGTACHHPCSQQRRCLFSGGCSRQRCSPAPTAPSDTDRTPSDAHCNYLRRLNVFCSPASQLASRLRLIPNIYVTVQVQVQVQYTGLGSANPGSLS